MRMSIKVTVGKLRNSRESIAVLSRLRGLGNGNAWKVSRLMIAVEEEMSKVRKPFEELLNEHSKKDESGKAIPVTNDDGSVGFEVSNPELYKKELEQLNDTEIMLDAEIATPAMFETCDIPPQFFIDLSWWIVDPDKLKVVENKT